MNRINWRFITRLLPVILSVLLIAGCGGGSLAKARETWAQKPDGECLVGVAGPMANMKERSRYLDGIEMALDEINTSGGLNGKKIQIVPVDDQAKTMDGIALAQSFAADPKVMAVLGHWNSYVALPVASIYEESGIIMLTSTATTPKLTKMGYRYIFRNVPNDEIMGKQMAMVSKELGHQKIAVYYADSDYGRGLADAFEKSASAIGISIIDRVCSFSNAIEKKEAFKKWKALDVDGVFIADSLPGASEIVKDIKTSGLQVQVIGGDGFDYDNVIASLGSAAEGMVIPTLFNADAPNPRLQKFIEDFKGKYGGPPDAKAVQGYETMQLLFEAMTKAQSTSPAKVASALREIQGWAGLTGGLSVLDSGDVSGKQIYIKLVKNGRFEYMKVNNS